MAGTTLKVNQNHTLSFSPTRRVLRGPFVGRCRLHLKDLVERQTEHGGTAHTKHASSRNSDFFVANIFSGLSKNGKHTNLLSSIVGGNSKREFDLFNCSIIKDRHVRTQYFTKKRSCGSDVPLKLPIATVLM